MSTACKDTMMLYRSSLKARCDDLVNRFDTLKAQTTPLSDTQETVLTSQTTLKTVRMMKGVILGAAIGGHDAMCVSLEFLGDMDTLERNLTTYF